MSYEIHNADCYDFIKSIPDKSIDLVYIDIPYLIEQCGKEIKKSPIAQRIQRNEHELRGYCGKEIKKLQELKDAMINSKNDEEYERNRISFNRLQENIHLKTSNIINGIDYSIFEELCRIMKRIYIYIWCSKEQINDIMNFFIQEKKCRFNLLVWCKTNPTPATNGSWLPDIEYCLVFKEDGTPRYNDGYELKSKWYVSAINKGDKDLYDHPTIKPLELVKRHILHSTQEGDTVLDCFMGSGTTGVACVETNRNFIGVEIDPHYFKIAEDRLKGISQKDRRNEQYEKENGIIRFDF